MAENKKSFLFYANWIDTFKALPKDKGYDLLMHILSYVNDENPTTDDVLINATFQNIKNSLKVDLKKWEQSIEEKSKGGIIGNLKRWHLDLYERYNSGLITLDLALSIAESRKPSHTDNMQSVPIAEIAVNVSDNVNDLNKDIDTEVKKTSSLDFNKFINYFNSKAGRKFRVTEAIKTKLKARLKDYTKIEIIQAIDNAHLDAYHKENNFKYLTPEFILRPDKLEKFLNQPSQQNQSNGVKMNLALN